MAQKSSKTNHPEVKQHLKTMTKNGKAHRLRSTRRIIRYGTISFTRNIWLSIAATLVMTFTLLVLFLTVATSVILSSTAETMREKIDITLFFAPETPQRALDEIAETLRADPSVKELTTASAEQNTKDFLKDNSEKKYTSNATFAELDLEDDLLNGMPSTIRIKVHDVNDTDSLEKIISTDRTIKSKLTKRSDNDGDNRQAIETITSWSNIATNGGLILSVIFLVISVLVIFNTIRMAIFSRREEIYMMKLVGADNSFIRGPFLIEAQMCGVISGVIACTLGYAGFRIIAPRLTEYGINVDAVANILNSQWLVVIYLVCILMGIIIGTISARLAIRRYLHKA